MTSFWNPGKRCSLQIWAKKKEMKLFVLKLNENGGDAHWPWLKWADTDISELDGQWFAPGLHCTQTQSGPSRPSLQDKRQATLLPNSPNCSSIPSQRHHDAMMCTINHSKFQQFHAFMSEFLLSRNFKILYHVKNHQYPRYDRTR